MMRHNFRMKSAGAALAVIALLQAPGLGAQQARGGFVENPGNAVARANPGSSTLRDFIPERGSFTFPAPYNTQAVRLTNASDCAGRDCVNYAGYSYWRNMNNHVGMDTMLIFLGLDQTRGGKGPTLFEMNKTSGALTNLGPLFPPNNRLSWATGEGWYFSATMPTVLYVNDGPRIARFDVITEKLSTVVDVTGQFGSGVMLTQMHSSDNDRVHSATVRNSANSRVMGCMAYEEDRARYHFYPANSSFDECQVDRSGEWLVIKSDLDGRDGEDNLIVNLRTGRERILRDKEGAAGHSDLGHGYMVAADNWATEANAWKVWDFNEEVLKGKRVYSNKDWKVFAPAHVSHTNARAGVPASQQYACGSSVNRERGTHANEIVCFTLDGSSSSVVVAPVMTNLDASGGGDEYERYAKGNLDVTGRFFLWTSNLGGERLDAFVVRVPDHLLTGSGGRAPEPAPPVIPAPVATPVPTPVPVPPVAATPPPVVPAATPVPASGQPVRASGVLQWQASRNISVAGRRQTKTSGCNGCADAGAVSLENSGGGDAHLDFTVRSSWALMAVGLTRSQTLPGIADMRLGLRLQSGVAEVRELGVYRADVRYREGDRFTIRIQDGRVSYAHNGRVFHSSPYSDPYRLYAGTSFSNIDAAVEDILLYAE